MVRFLRTPLAAVVLLLFTLGQARAETYIYSGLLPDDGTPGFVFVPSADMAGLVSPGDSWKVSYAIDLTAADVDNGSSFGDYPAAILQATVEIGGYSATHDFEFGGIVLYNDFDWGGPQLEDGVLSMLFQGNIGLLAEASTEITTANPLTSDALPVSPTLINHSLEPPLDPLAQLQVFQYVNGQLGGQGYWEISYLASSGVVFQAVPEPSTITLWCVALVGLGGVWWRKRRAA